MAAQANTLLNEALMNWSWLEQPLFTRREVSVKTMLLIEAKIEASTTDGFQELNARFRIGFGIGIEFGIKKAKNIWNQNR